MAAIGHTIAVVDRSGKVVSTSKHLFNVFKEAKCAYRERKAEIVAGRQHELQEKKLHRLKIQAVEDDRSATSSRKSSKSKHTSRRPTHERHHSEGSVRSPTSPNPRSPKSQSPKSPIYPESYHQFEQGTHFAPSERHELARRHTDHVGEFTPPPTPRRTMSSPTDIDMDLAYGDIPPPLPVATLDEEAELKGLVGKVKLMLEEADCLQYSATAIIASLQQNPDAMAAVALTLAEISNIASKMAPGALLAMKGSAPAVFALLASPQFLIAAGVGVGITIVALGGFKIIKKIKANNNKTNNDREQLAPDAGMDEMLELGSDVSRIDTWRRGIVTAEEQSVGTSVDGEFITPHAAAVSRLSLNDDGTKASRQRRHKSRSSEKATSEADSAPSKKSSSSSRGSSNGSGSKGPKEKREKKERKEKKEKKPSPLRLMFS